MYTKLDLAFKLMRKKGLIAKQNFCCCSNCAISELTSIVNTKFKQCHTINGIVFYHRQDSNSRKSNNGFHISYGQMNAGKNLIGIDPFKIAMIVINCLKEVGIEYEWSGNTDDRIYIKPGY